MLPTRHILAALLVLSAAIAGCGSLSRDELGRRVDALSSIAAEGRLLARDVEHDRARSTFVRVQARTLADAATHEAEKVTDATPAPGTGTHRRQTIAAAERLSDVLGELSVHPGDEQRGAQIGLRLIAVQHQLDQLGRRT